MLQNLSPSEEIKAELRIERKGNKPRYIFLFAYVIIIFSSEFG